VDDISSASMKQLYKNSREIFKTMKGIGAMNASRKLPEGMRSRKKIEDMIDHYERNFRSGEHVYATYQIIRAVCTKI
jgi:hypothetical protein